VTAVVLAGLGVGGGLVALGSALWPARRPLGAALARLHEPRPPTAATSVGRRESLLGAPLARTSLGRAVTSRLAVDLRVVGVSGEALLSRQVLAALVCLLIVPACLAVMAIGGVGVSPIFPMWASLVLSAGGLALPALEMRMQAAERRRSFRHALGCFLDLVAVRLAGGAGVESALSDSAAAGQGWAFMELRQALSAARLQGEPPWAGLARLGTELGIAELGELAATAALAGDEGARVRASIAAKARALRVRGLADAEGAAQAASERMSLPIVLLLVGFILFLGFPAIDQVLHGL
jgi:Flp pilus assembly protein TadB